MCSKPGGESSTAAYHAYDDVRNVSVTPSRELAQPQPQSQYDSLQDDRRETPQYDKLAVAAGRC